MNVDLDVESAEDLRPLIDALEPHTFSFDRPAGQASFEVNDPSPKDPEVVILELVRLVKSLPPAARQVWDAASRRVFDIGLRSSRRPPAQRFNLGGATLREVASIGADVAITLYAVDPADDDEEDTVPASARTPLSE